FHLSGNKLYTWKGTNLSHFELQDDDSLLLLGTTMLPAAVEQATADGEILWLGTTTAEGSQWFALDGESLLGIFPYATRKLVITPSAAYFDVVRDGVTYIQARAIVVTAQSLALNVVASELPQTVELRVTPSADPLGALALHVETTAGQRVPAIISQVNG